MRLHSHIGELKKASPHIRYFFHSSPHVYGSDCSVYVYWCLCMDEYVVVWVRESHNIGKAEGR